MKSSPKSITRDEIMRLVPLVAREGRRISEAFADRENLHQTDMEALSQIMLAEVQNMPMTAGALGAELNITSGATTFLMNRLLRAGLIEKTRDATDSRKVILRLSETGHKLSSEIYPPVLQLSNAVMDRFTLEELQTVHRFLAATMKAMSSYRETMSSRQERED
jgi:DNA-binding MarR family transcriptional regulator